MVPVPVVSGTGTHLQNRVGTGTDASNSLDFCTLALLSSIFVHRLFRDPNKLLMGVQIRLKLSEKRTVPRRLGEAIFVKCE